MDPRTLVVSTVTRHGFDQVGFASVDADPRHDRFARWLEAGHHADLDWMARGSADRADPRRRLPAARTAVVLRVGHGHRVPPDPGGATARVARYAWGRDYHNLIGKRLRKVRRDLREAGVASWGGVDTAPILERGWAAAAGVGFPGRSGAQILPGIGSWSLLAVLFVDVTIAPDAPLPPRCGRCTRCVTACPTGALLGDGLVDARRCLSYWSIEATDRMPPDEVCAAWGRRLIGCDTCQEVCPHNHQPPAPSHPDLLPRHAWVDLIEVIDTPDDVLMERFRGTPLRRPKAHGLKRNALLALPHTPDDPRSRAAAERALAHSHPVVQAAARWALDLLPG